MKLRLVGWPDGRTHYLAPGCEPWAVGDVRDVAPDEAARLLADFPGVFAEEKPPRRRKPAKRKSPRRAVIESPPAEG